MRVLAIAAHPDDETLGCGGTLLKHAAQEDELYWLIATRAHDQLIAAETIARKTDEVEAVARAYGMRDYFWLPFPAARLETVSLHEIMGHIREVLTKVKPERVYLVHQGDVHTDHGVVCTATMSVIKPFYMDKLGVRKVLCYETLSSTEAAPSNRVPRFVPNAFNDISDHIDRKLDIMKLYETESHREPMPRSPSAILAQARVRGATVGVKYAEAFEVLCEIM